MVRRSREKNRETSGGDREFARCYLRVDRSRIAGIRFLLEAYDGVGFIRTIDAGPAVIEFSYPPSQGALAARLLEVLRREFGADRVPAPFAVGAVGKPAEELTR
ncbi:uncharacterized protein DUF4911 [Geothermobacter ehrlichii]|uniref:Uncharacterized protein DUF4911 n=1 Tax=Geothermobacter ehrlichii TaxID=213224 RepID=A0A5D3WL06_9BACT|nr:DUF4911 domain-containing protein [Geothermobacter ehrlichii]TYO98935.1 uncharacterized protein DUF4911 [Geothermobacter ehrlichii]